MNLKHQLDNTRTKWFIEEEEISLLGQNKNKSMIIKKIQAWPTKMTITSRDDHQQYTQLQPARTTTAKGNKNQQHLILHRYQLLLFTSYFYFKGIGLLVHKYFYFFCSENKLCTCSCTDRKKQVPFSMAIGNEELVHKCFPKHSLMGTARMK